MNKVQILGTITRDIEIKYAQSVRAIASFGIAYNDTYKQQDGTKKEVVHFFDCTAFGRTGEVINQFFRKGSRILIDGSLQYQSYVSRSSAIRSVGYSVDFSLKNGTKDRKNGLIGSLNTGVTELMKKLMKDGVTDEMYKWVSRDEFESHKNDDDWYGGLIKTCWSFGNNQKDYLFAKEREEDKRILHEIIVNRCEESRNAFCVKFDDYYLLDDDIQNDGLLLCVWLKVRLDALTCSSLSGWISCSSWRFKIKVMRM